MSADERLMLDRSQRIVVLGSTGSIGRQTLDVVDRLRRTGHSLEIVGLAAGRNIELLERQIESFGPGIVSIAAPDAAERLVAKYPDLRQVLSGPTCFSAKICTEFYAVFAWK